MKFDFCGELYVEISEASSFNLKGSNLGLIIVDEVKGFCQPGMGNLAPPSYDREIADMVTNTNNLARRFADNKLPIMSMADCHSASIPEPPYPPHCIKGSGEEELVDQLQWLLKYSRHSQIKKDCINGFIAAINAEGENTLIDWLTKNYIEDLVVVGICTDICVLQLVQSLLSARNTGLIELNGVHVDTSCCATYDLPLAVARQLKLPDSAAHPRELTHAMGLYLMAQSGAFLTRKVELL